MQKVLSMRLEKDDLDFVDTEAKEEKSGKTSSTPGISRSGNPTPQSTIIISLPYS